MAEAIATWLHDSNPVEQLHCGGLQGSPLIKGFHGQAPILGTLLPRGSSSESEHSVWRDGVSHGSLQAGNVAITPRDPQLQTERWSPISGSEGAAARPSNPTMREYAFSCDSRLAERRGSESLSQYSAST